MTAQLTLVLALGLALSHPVHADEGADHPCKAIKEACEAAGYKKGDHKKTGKGLFIDCMKQIMDGKPVAGVNIPAAELESCKVKKQEHQEKKAAKHP